MGKVQSLGNDQRRSKGRFAIYEFSSGTAVLFATEPKYKCRNVRMYHVYKIVESGNFGQAKVVAIINYVNV